jgi:hypothetical protein
MHWVPGLDGTAAAATLGVHGEWTYAVVDVSDNTTTVYTGPVILHGVYVNTVLSNHELPIKNGTTAVVTIPAQAAAGAIYQPFDIVFDTSLVVDPNDAATGSITVAYRPL